MPRWRFPLALGLGLALACSPETPTAPGGAIVELPRPVSSAVSSGQNGVIVFTSSPDGEFAIWGVNGDGSNLSKQSSPDDFESSWSPDGSKVAFSSAGDIHVIDVDLFVDTWEEYALGVAFGLGENRTNLTNYPGDDGEPAWSPDGTKIAFFSNRDGNAEIYVMNADGSGQTRLTNDPAADRQPSWSPDGTKLAFERNGEIYVMNPDGSGQTTLTNNSGGAQPDWSPDGTEIAFVRDGEIYVMNPDGSGQTNLTNNPADDEWPTWSPDGTKLAFSSNRDNQFSNIWVMKADGSGPTSITPFPGMNAFQPDWGPGPASLVLDPSVVPIGVNVVAQPVDAATGTTPVRVTFDLVNGGGAITLTSSAQGALPPPGFSDPPVYYELDATQVGRDPGVTLCFTYDPATYQNPATLKLFHDVDGTWTDLTTSHDQAGHVICGRAMHLFSPTFILAEAVPPGATPIGSSVVVQPVDPATNTSPVTLTFGNVTNAGATTVSSSTEGPSLPLGFRLADSPVYYEVATTAEYSGSITVCFTYDPAAYQSANVRLLHGEAGVWTDVTTSLDPGGHVICGTTTSLSPFITAELHYNFTGFFQPVDNGKVLNVAKAGSSIPVKFSLGGDLGLDILTTNSPTTGVISCNSIPTIDQIEELTTSPGGLHIGNNQYTYVWTTKAEWKGTCRKFMLNLKDGTQREALFQFK